MDLPYTIATTFQTFPLGYLTSTALVVLNWDQIRQNLYQFILEIATFLPMFQENVV